MARKPKKCDLGQIDKSAQSLVPKLLELICHNISLEAYVFLLGTTACVANIN